MQAVPTRGSRARRGRRAAALALLALAAGCGRGDERPPNVVIVLLDTLRPDRLGCFGYERDTSPVLDAIAPEFFLFESAQSSAPWTAPSLVTLMTALYPDAHGVIDSPYPARLPDAARTLAEVLRDRGYATAAFTEGGYARGDFGLDQGFDLYVVEDLPESGLRYEAVTRRLERNLDRALAWVAEQGERPFFLFFHTYEVHSPRLPPEEHVRRFRPGYDAAEHRAAVEEAIEAWNERRELSAEAARVIQLESEVGAFTSTRPPKEGQLLRQRAAELGVHLEHERLHEEAELVSLVNDLYDAETRWMDEQLGRLWSALREGGHWDDSVIVLTSDHGEGLGAHGRIGHGSVLHEEVLRVLLMIRAPGDGLRPRRVAETVRSVDVMPTVLQLADLSPAGTLMQGESLVPLMRGGGRAREAFSHAVKTAAGEEVVQHSIRDEDWRLIVDARTGEARLFDRRADPEELVDLAERRPEVVARLRERLERQMEADAAIRDRLGRSGPGGVLDPAVLRELEGLGYIGGDGEE